MTKTVPTYITHEPDWHHPLWEEGESRPAWFVTCDDHPSLGRDSTGEPWGYATSGLARMVRTRHLRAKHGIES